MTILVLNYKKNRFQCVADSLISFGNGMNLSVYSKNLIVPVVARYTYKGVTKAYRQQIGMAISGNLAAATSVYTIFCGAAQSLHTHDTTDPPSFFDLAGLAKKIGTRVYDEVRALGPSGLFGFFLFGYDMKSGEPRAYIFQMEKSNDGIFELCAKECIIEEHCMFFQGGGARKFREYLNTINTGSFSLPDLVYNFIQTRQVPTVGGIPQVMSVAPSGATIEPVIVGKALTIYHSGMEMDGYKSVGQYMVGLRMEGINIGPGNGRK